MLKYKHCIDCECGLQVSGRAGNGTILPGMVDHGSPYPIDQIEPVTESQQRDRTPSGPAMVL